jgi:hypothetical protein
MNENIEIQRLTKAIANLANIISACAALFPLAARRPKPR